MRKILATLILFLCVLTANAQGVDPILTQLLQENKETVAMGKAHRLKHVAPQTVNGVDTLEIQRRVNVSFHPDGSIRQLCILGTLADDANCPDSQLEALGIKVVCTVGRLVIMDVPAEAFTTLSQMTEFKWLAADRVHQVDNTVHASPTTWRMSSRRVWLASTPRMMERALWWVSSTSASTSTTWHSKAITATAPLASRRLSLSLLVLMSPP